MSDIHSETPETLYRRRPGRPRKNENEAPIGVRSGRIEVAGRDGVMLSRKRSGNIDPLAIPPHIIPDGWDYQWNVHTVAGEHMVDVEIGMAENGWRAVPSDRHAGMFMPEGYTGAIIRGGLRLDERPMALTIEARHEEYEKGVSQMRDNRAQFGIRDKLARGFDEQRFGRGRAPGPGIRSGIEAATDVPRPQYDIDPNG